MSDTLAGLRLQPKQMLDELSTFLERIAALAQEVGLNAEKMTVDHLALRINEHQVAEQAHQAWLAYGEQISCAEINGRPIIVLRFANPPQAFASTIECLELPYPAPGKTYPQQGWEHVEFVLPSAAVDAEAYLADLKRQFPLLAEKWPQLAQSGIKTKLSSPKGEGERLANPTVAFKKDGVCIKLHPHSLREVVESEQEL